MDDSSLDYLGEVIPYHYIGDSHAGVIGSLEFQSAGGQRIITRVSGIWRFVAADMLDADGMVSEAVMQALRRVGAFHSSTAFAPVPGLRAILTTYGNEKRPEQPKTTESANHVPYVFNVGEINARYVLYRLVMDQIDFAVPFATNGLDRLSSQTPRQVLSAEQMLRLLAEEFTPLFRGLRILQNAGLRTLYLHCVPPPAVDDVDSERVLKHRSPGRLRYKLAMFINYLYEAVCRETGIGFVNTWPLVSRDNILDSEYYLDGLHLNRKHAILSVREVHRHFTARQASAQAEELVS